MIEGVNNFPTTTAWPEGGDKRIMEKDDFLKLLVAQLKNQDPLSPLDSFEFTAQLSRFSQLEQLMNLNAAMEDVQWLLGSSVILGAVSFIGKEVTAAENTIWLEDEEATPIHYRIQQQVSSLRVTIYDEDYQVVRVIDLGPRDPGEGEAIWDGRDGKGTLLPSGKYHFKVEAEDTSGNPVEVPTWVQGKVTGLTVEDGEVCLLMGNLPISLSSIMEVRETE